MATVDAAIRATKAKYGVKKQQQQKKKTCENYIMSSHFTVAVISFTYL